MFPRPAARREFIPATCSPNGRQKLSTRGAEIVVDGADRQKFETNRRIEIGAFPIDDIRLSAVTGEDNGRITICGRANRSAERVGTYL
ncbi:Hypothetical protein NTJ_12450 [Nesidiocoris tenuis]|uniref:Uncharacterized protein n=1 Tax=Nesidiocoris tenuis TaxID=355587 RepID=A0ABN7B5U5_9HEMI|nr:Hypothetical protein NTJ_12450 [Nesidiocoris tenuis]